MFLSGNPFANIKRIENSQKLLDIAFSKAMKIKPPGGKVNGLTRSRNHEMNRINTAANVIVDRLEGIVKSVPSLNLIHPFYFELASILVDIDSFKLALARIQGMIKTIRNVQSELVETIIQSEIKKENKQIRKVAFGRFSSIVYQLETHFKVLEDFRHLLQPLPGFNPQTPSIVVSGVPNSGKSSFIKLTTSGKPEVASYPFTTKELIFGHRNFGFLSVQFIDTPGLLDRALEKRNVIELQAITALKHLSDIMIFLIDNTSTSTSSIEEQINLLQEINEFYSPIKLLVVISKIDLLSKQEIENVKEVISKKMNGECEIISMHTVDDTGVDEILRRIDEILKQEVLKNSKFQEILSTEIDPDQLPSEDDLIWKTDLNVNSNEL